MRCLRDRGLEDPETKTLRAAVRKERDLPMPQRWGARRTETRGQPSEKLRVTADFN